MEDLKELGTHYKERAAILHLHAKEKETGEEEIKMIEHLSYAEPGSEKAYEKLKAALIENEREFRLRIAKGYHQKAENAYGKYEDLSDLSNQILEALHDAQSSKRKLIRQTHDFLPFLGEEEQL